MNLIVVLLVLILDIKSRRDDIKIRNVVLFENDFWDTSDKQVESGQLQYLGKTTLFIKDKNNNYVAFNFYLKNFRSLETTNRKYTVLEDFLTEDTISSLKSSMNENEFFKFELFFAEKLIEDRFQFLKYRGKAQNHITLKVSSNKINQRQKQNDVVLEYDGVATRKSNIKDMLGRFVYLHILKINDYIAKINKSDPSVGLETKDFKAAFLSFIIFKQFSALSNKI
ncbi:hypothetical protein NBO_61g0008 [Nosema bombycis CQ1]|uniref:Uncharacterized protein n=1 Tax=Nosema bombycis (strain CQ1 / CVCC 102059) TaxID=578461 RepID=R0KU31_NOSB1|nr:hypothetical protein NBO_61g0008 [Nosema bombycis CQ1]|eukprot:EOB13737.1 hypothetical protein NBO_61g0008 [Nosema bombycis CQ1]